MLSPLVQERIAPPTDVFFCDCQEDCVDSIKLSTEAVDLLMHNTKLMLLIGKHTSERAGEPVKKGKGWKVCKVVESPKGI